MLIQPISTASLLGSTPPPPLLPHVRLAPSTLHFTLPYFLYVSYQLVSNTSPLPTARGVKCHLSTYFYSNLLLGYLLLCSAGSIFGGKRGLSYLFLPSLPIQNNLVSLNRTSSRPLVV